MGPPTVNCTIAIKGTRARISGEFPVGIVRLATSWDAPGKQFSPKYQRNEWDGRIHLFDRKLHTFPSGLLALVQRTLRTYDPEAQIRIVDCSPPLPMTARAGFDLVGIKFGADRYGYQLEAARAVVRHRCGILKLATNSGKTEIAVAVTKHLGLPTLHMVPNSVTLLRQTQKRYAMRMGVPLDAVGCLGDGDASFGDQVTVAMPVTLAALLESRADRPAWKLVWIDEAHHAPADDWYQCLRQLDCPWRIGLSGTPLDRCDGADLKLIAQTGEIIYEVTNRQLIDLGVSVRPHVKMIRLDKPKNVEGEYADVHREAVMENPFLEELIAARVRTHTSEGRRTLVLVHKVEHGKKLTDELSSRLSDVSILFLHGKHSTAERDAGVRAFSAKRVMCLVATGIFGEGFDLPDVDAIVMADSNSSRIQALQRVGRGLRSRPGKDRIYVDDFANFCHPSLLRQSLERLETYRNEGCFVLTAA